MTRPASNMFSNVVTPHNTACSIPTWKLKCLVLKGCFWWKEEQQKKAKDKQSAGVKIETTQREKEEKEPFNNWQTPGGGQQDRGGRQTDRQSKLRSTGTKVPIFSLLLTGTTAKPGPIPLTNSTLLELSRQVRHLGWFVSQTLRSGQINTGWITKSVSVAWEVRIALHILSVCDSCWYIWGVHLLFNEAACVCFVFRVCFCKFCLFELGNMRLELQWSWNQFCGRSVLQFWPQTHPTNSGAHLKVYCTRWFVSQHLSQG